MKKKISAEARERIRAAQKKRWARYRKEKNKKGKPKKKAKEVYHVVVGGGGSGKKSFLNSALPSRAEFEKIAQKLIDQCLYEAERSSTWTTGAGDTIRMCDMEEGHLRNAISYCARKLSSKLLNAVWLAEVETMVTSFSNLLAEAKRRGLLV